MIVHEPLGDDPAGPHSDTTTEAAPVAAAPIAANSASEPDLATIGRELDDVQAALGRLDDGTYWTDEVTGDPIPDDVLAGDPTARRAG